ncbi:MAG: hypothetical protein ABEJ72_03450 [Candidatus Aenigmatarchaeota archaeon]
MESQYCSKSAQEREKERQTLSYAEPRAEKEKQKGPDHEQDRRERHYEPIHGNYSYSEEEKTRRTSQK